MIGTIRRHQTWLWVFLIAIMSVSLVVTFGPSQRMGNGNTRGGGSSFGYLAGKPITQSDFTEARREVLLGYLLQNQKVTEQEAPQITQQTYQRLFFINKQRELGIQVGTQSVAETARQMLGPNTSLDAFAEQMLKPAGFTLEDFERLVRHDIGLQQLIKVAGMSGKLVTPQEAETIYRLEHRDVDTSVALFTASNYLSKVSATPEDIAKFYTNQMANYRIPDQVQVQYVKFPLNSYSNAAMGVLTNLDKDVKSFEDSLGTNLYKTAHTPAESRQAIRNDFIRGAEVREAGKAALAFAQQIDAATNHDLQTFNKLAASNHLTVATTAPFDRDYGPSSSEMMVSPDFTRKAFDLTPQDPFAGPIMPDQNHPADGVYVIFLKDHNPSRVPPFREIEAKVSSDYKYAMAAQTAQKEAVRFHGLATNGLAQGKSWKAICADAGVQPESLPPFNLNSRSLPGNTEENISFSILRQVAFATPAGKVGPAAPARGGAFVLYVNKVLPVDEAKFKQEFPAYLAMIRQGRQEDAFNQWCNVQLSHDPEFVQTLNQLRDQAQARSGSARRPRS